MEQQQVAKSSPLEVKTGQSPTPMEPQTEPQVEVDVNTNKKKKKKKKKSRRKSLERTQSEVEEMQKAEDKPKPEEEGEEDETNQKQEEPSPEEITGKVEGSIEATAVTKEASIEETTVAEKASIEETTVKGETSIEKTVETKEETVETEVHHDDEAEVSGDELGPPSLERQSSLDSFKATGTRAVGSLFSRFKVGRKKPLASRTESTTTSELANPSPVKTAVKRLEVPEEKILNDLSMQSKSDIFGEGEQSINVSAEKDKYDPMEKQRSSEKEAEEAAKAATAAKQTSSSSSNEELLSQVDAATEEDAVSSSIVGKSVEAEVSEIKVTSVSTDSATVELSAVAASETSEIVVDKTAEPEEAAPVVELAVLEAAESGDDRAAATNMEGDNVAVSATKLAADTAETTQQTTGATTTLPAFLKLDLDLDINTETEKSSHEDAEEVVIDSTEASVEAVVSNEIVQEEAPSVEETEILPVKVAPPTPELAAEVSLPAEPEKMSPVKSLASRFEGKREQSLDSLKFRTVREFFSEERSVRVGAEKQKYEALTEQQKLKDKAEDEAKSKYNTFKSPVKENDVNATATVDKDITVAADPASGLVAASGVEAVNFSTPETVVTRKKFSFDAATNSPAKFSDDASEAVTPVKSIASRFEGKREQSLDSLKFRTVREFFPEERSVRVGSEKQKFEAQAQQENSLDKLKFRTVREFFPSESKRSVHVGAEKAKFEALTKQQDESAKAAEQIKLKHAALSAAPSATKIESHGADPVSLVTNVVSSSTLDESPVEVEPNSTGRALEPNDDGVLESVEDPATDEIPSSVSEETAPEQVKGTDEINTLTLTAGESSIKEDICAPTIHGATEDVVSIEPVAADDGGQDSYVDIGNTEANQVSAEAELKIEQGVMQEVEQTVEHEVTHEVRQEVKQIVENETEHELKHEVESQPEEETEQEVSQEIEQVAEKRAGGDIKLDDVDLDESIVGTQTEPTSDVVPIGTGFSEQTTLDTVLVDQEMVDRVEQRVDGDVADRLVELDQGEPVSAEVQNVDTQQLEKDQESAKEGQPEAVESIESAENGLVELDLGGLVAEKPQVDSNQEAKSKSRPMLTTERSFVMEDDHTIETEDTVVVGERPMTDGEDEFEPLSPTKARPAHELFSGNTTSSTKKSSTSAKKKMVKSSNDSKTSPKLTRKVSVGSTGSAKSSTTVPVPMKRASISAPTASYMAKKAAEAEELHRSSPQLKKQGSASKLKGTVSDTGFIKPPPAAPTVPVPMKRASITAPTASYMAKKADEAEKLHRASPQPKQHRSVSKQKGTVSETGFVKPPPAAPTVHAPMKRASITAPTASWQARHVPDHTREENAPRSASKKHTSKVKGTLGPTGFVKPTPSPSTVPVAPKRASIMAPTASYMAKKATENAEENSATFSSAPTRNKRYSNVKSKVLEGIESGSLHAVTHKTITKEEFIAAERRKSLGSAGVRGVLDAVDRRASLTARVAIDCPPEPFVRSAFSRKKLESTVPRYMNYENAPGYAERARQQYERRKRLEEENAAKSEKRQRELRMHFAEKQQKAQLSSAEEVRRGLEAHEFARLAKDSENAVQKTLRKEKQQALSTRSHHRPSSTTSGSSSNGFASRASKKSSVSSVEEKVVTVATVELTVLETEEELVESATVETVESVEPLQDEVATEEQEVVVEAGQVEEQTIPMPVVDEDPALEHVAKKIDFDEASSDSDDVSNK
ncbi:hypothetical protein PRIC2_005664 [Phytophthora ramorum]